jgi:hypothetical protein
MPFERHVGVPTIEQNVYVPTIAQNVDAPTIEQHVDAPTIARADSSQSSIRNKKKLIGVTECCFTWKKCCFT